MVCRQERVPVAVARRHAAVRGRHWPAWSHWLYVTVQRSAHWCRSLVLRPCFRCCLASPWFAMIRFACSFRSLRLKV